MDKRFDFRQCWTCDYLIFDIMDHGYICPKTGREFSKKQETVQPTLCRHWTRETTIIDD